MWAEVPVQLLLAVYILALLFGEGVCLMFNASSNRNTFCTHC